MIIFGQYIEIKTKNENENFEKRNRNWLAVFVHLIISFVNYFEMKDILKFRNIFKFIFSNRILFSN